MEKIQVRINLSETGKPAFRIYSRNEILKRLFGKERDELRVRFLSNHLNQIFKIRTECWVDSKLLFYAYGETVFKNFGKGKFLKMNDFRSRELLRNHKDDLQDIVTMEFMIQDIPQIKGSVFIRSTAYESSLPDAKTSLLIAKDQGIDLTEHDFLLEAYSFESDKGDKKFAAFNLIGCDNYETNSKKNG